MSPILDKITRDLKTAMKEKDAARLQVLRSLKSRLLEKEISERKGKTVTLDDEQVQQVLLKAAKQRKDSLEQYRKAGRDDLAKTENFELEVIESYLPEMLNADEIKELAKKTVQETGASTAADMGKVMGALMPKVKGKADGSLVNQIVRELLN